MTKGPDKQRGFIERPHGARSHSAGEPVFIGYDANLRTTEPTRVSVPRLPSTQGDVDEPIRAVETFECRTRCAAESLLAPRV
jgi:hypothetical protein